ncbi:MAG: excinuclease ABC subunit UvrC [candidate division WOR-3 bacterium]
MNKVILRELVRSAPSAPGVYIFRDRKGAYLYVGKARDISARLSSYLSSDDPKTRAMLARAHSLEWLVTGSEAEALFTESSLVRFQKPPFNIRLAGGEYYPYIKITVKEPWPRIFPTRKLVEDGSLYFGPYPDAAAARRTIQAIRSLFPIRPCNYSLPSGKVKLCIYYHMGRCPGPCELEVDPALYASYIKGAIDLLSGRGSDAEREIESAMTKAAEELRFETAAALRDRLLALRKTLAAPAGFGEGGESRDIIVLSSAGNIAAVVLYALREGRPGVEERFLMESPRDTEPPEIISAFLKDYYTSRPINSERLVCVPLPDELPLLEEVFSERAGRRIRITKPGRNDRSFVEIAAAAAEEHLMRALEKARKPVHQGLRELAEIFGADNLERIECFDISHTSGKETVASCVVFLGTRPAKSLYRRFKIRTARPSDDYGAMKEVIYRRLRRLIDEKQELPDAILIDGGPGQLSAGLAAMEELGLSIPAAALAKRYEELYLPDGGQIILPGRSKALILLKRIRDEAHRFAVSYHRTLRGRRGMGSVLDGLEGIGPERKKALMRYFGSLDRLRGASLEEIERVPGIGKKLAREIYEFLR